MAYTAHRTGKDWHVILAGAQAFLQQDGGLAWRRWLLEHKLG
jgi:hypothetical protein